MDRVQWIAVPAPIGTLGVAVDATGLCRVHFSGPGGAVADRPAPLAVAAAGQLARYFAGELTEFDLPLSITTGSPFERAV